MFEYVVDIFEIFLLFGIFGFVHSYLASNKVKKILTENFGDLIAFYRMLYIIISLVSLYFIYDILPRPHLIIYDLQNPYDLLILIPQFLGLVGFFWTLKYFCVKEFLGINQIIRWKNKQYHTEELDEELTLRIEGPYKYIRHPLYFFSIIFLMFRPEMDLFYLTIFICAVLYFYIGSIYEERKLVKKFGEEYENYQKLVPRLIPRKPFNPYKTEESIT